MRPIAVLTLTEGGARSLSFLFYVLAARALTPHGFGRVRYTLTIVLIGFFVLQVVVKAIARELGAARGKDSETDRLVGSSVAVAGLLLVVTGAGCCVAGRLDLLGPVDVTGLIVALIGYTAFQVYYAIARGIGETLRPALAYVGGSLVQLLAFAALVAVGAVSARLALIVYGVSSLVPIFVCELTRPVVIGRLSFSLSAAMKLIGTGLPLLVGQVAFIVWNSADQIWVQAHLGTRDIGLYGAARNLSQLFIVVPTGVGVALLPRVAELRAARAARAARRLALGATAGVSVVTLVLALSVIAGRLTLLRLLYGPGYEAAAPALFFQSVGMVFYSGFATLTVAAIGWGWARLSVFGIAVAGAAEVVCLVVLPGDGLARAGAAFATSIGVAFVFVLVWSCLRGDHHLMVGEVDCA
jgi:O-antigen/teichoic acid export membrane protein